MTPAACFEKGSAAAASTGRPGLRRQRQSLSSSMPSRAAFAELGLSIERLGDWPDRLRQRGQRVVFVALDGQTIGLLGVVDAAP